MTILIIIMHKMLEFKKITYQKFNVAGNRIVKLHLGGVNKLEFEDIITFSHE